MGIKKWRKKQVTMVEYRQRKVIGSVMYRMNKIMKEAAELIISNYLAHRQYKEPSLLEMFNISADFYESVVRAAIKTSEDTKSMQINRKKLALGLPKGKKALERIFGQSKYWQRILNRSIKLTDRMRRQYQRKLKTQFDKIVPHLLNGEMTPGEAKKHMTESWATSKPKVETIFRTETTNYFGRTQVAYFEDDDEIIGFLFDALHDGGTTEICSKRHGLVYRPRTKLLQDNTPALHYNCRSHLIPLANTSENRKMLGDPSRSPSNRTVPPLPPGWSDGSRSKYKTGFKKGKRSK